MPDPDMRTLKRVVHCEEDGTTLSNVVEANRILRGDTHDLVFGWREYASFADLQKELDEDRPVIAWIKPNRLTQICHSIVIKEISETDLKVKVNDPDSIETKEYETTMFMNAWDNSDRVLIHATVSEREAQREISDYP